MRTGRTPNGAAGRGARPGTPRARLAAKRLARVALAAALALLPGAPGPVAAPVAAPLAAAEAALRARPGPPTRPNADMARDILDLAFGLEDGRSLPALSRFDGPVRVRLDGEGGAALDDLVGRLRDEAGLDVRRVEGEAEIVVEAVPAEALAAVAPGAACFTVPGAASWEEFLARRGTAALDWARVVRRERAAVFVPEGAAPELLRDCLHEEVAQALGPLDDLWRLPDSVFNDDNVRGALTGFDMLALRALYALPVGLGREEAERRLPALLARLNPGGERPSEAAPLAPFPGWAEALAQALAPDAPVATRAAAALDAARSGPSSGPGAGLALYALGRLRAASDPEGARAAFRAARAAYGEAPETALHRAGADLQLAAFALRDGDPRGALALALGAEPVAGAEGAVALLGTLRLVRAEALDALGRGTEADALRLDSLPLLAYGFGAGAVPAVLAQARALRPGV